MHGSSVGVWIMSGVLPRQGGRIFLTEAQKQTVVATLRRTVNETSINDTSDEQEAQLPLRNRASAMHFFEAKLLYITVMTYNCV